MLENNLESSRQTLHALYSHPLYCYTYYHVVQLCPSASHKNVICHTSKLLDE